MIDHVQGSSLAFDLAQASPTVLQRALQEAPWLGPMLEEMRARFPAAPSAQPFQSDEYFRPVGHRRAFYRTVAGGAAVVAFKGTEVRAGDLEPMARWIHARHDRMESPLEGFPIQEHKAPGVLLLEEAMSEAQAALAFQSRWVSAYPGLPRTPLPLLVLRWPEETVQRYQAAIGRLLSSRARAIVERLIAGGLAAYAYYYPGRTVRATEVQDRAGLVAAGYRSRKSGHAEAFSFEATVESWIRLVARMLALGFMPVSVSSDQSGQLVQPQNATVDGGFVDMDSLQPIAQIAGDGELATTLWLLVRELSFTVTALLGGSASRALEKLRGVQHVAAAARVFEMLRDFLREEQAAGVTVDPRLARLVLEERGVAALDRLFSLQYPG